MEGEMNTAKAKFYLRKPRKWRPSELFHCENCHVGPMKRAGLKTHLILIHGIDMSRHRFWTTVKLDIIQDKVHTVTADHRRRDEKGNVIRITSIKKEVAP